VYVKIVVFDLSTLRYRLSAKLGRVTALAPTGEILARVDVAPATSPREASYLAANAALDQGRVVRDGETCRIALYNPYSGEASLNAVPATVVYSAGAPISLDEAGTTFEMKGDRLVSDETVMHVVAPSVARTSRAILAHSL
jgi:hypothetical protein